MKSITLDSADFRTVLHAVEDAFNDACDNNTDQSLIDALDDALGILKNAQRNSEGRTFLPIGKVASDTPIFHIGDNVIVHRTDSDEWLCDEFMAKINDILDNGDIIVEDQDSDFFTVKPYQLEHNND